MSLVRWSPFGELDILHDGINSLINDSVFWKSIKKSPDYFTPSVEIIETKEEYQVRADLPGVNKDQIDISVTGNTLTLKAERREEKKDEKENFFRREINYGSFQKQLILPKDADDEKIKALYEDGVLELRIPKSVKDKNKKISIA